MSVKQHITILHYFQASACAPSLRIKKNETSSSGFILRRRRVSRSSSLSFEEKWQRVKRQDGEFREKLVRNPVFSVKSCTMRANCLNETINLSLLDFIWEYFRIHGDWTRPVVTCFQLITFMVGFFPSVFFSTLAKIKLAKIFLIRSFALN